MSIKRLVRRHGTQAEWDADTTIIWEGEVAWARDTGVFKVGDGTKTWSQLGPLGGIYLGLDTPPLLETTAEWDDLRVPLSTAKLGATNPPTETFWRDDGSGSTGITGLRFSATQLQQVFFEAQMPHRYQEGTRIAPHCHFTTVVAPVAGQTVRFGLEYTYANVGEVFPLTTTIYATYTYQAGDVAYKQYIGVFDPDIEDANIKVSAMLSCRFFRDAANDTSTGTVTVLEVDFHHLVESLGSTNEFSK